MRAATYARYSTDKQREQSISDQQRVCDALAARHGFTVVARFSDKAISGGTTARPGYQEMLAAARRGEFAAICAEDVSRLWRSLGEQAPRLAELADLGVAVVTHDLDTRQEAGGMMSAVLGAGAEQYRREIGRKSRRGREGNALKGKWTGGRAYGYRVEHGVATVDPQAAAIVREIFGRYAAGESPLAIAAALNARRVPSPGSTWKRELRRRGGWVASCIAGDPKRGVGILNCDLYRGRVVWGRSKWIRGVADSKKRRQVQVPESQWIVREDARLRIVPDKLWDAVKARQARQSALIGARIKQGRTKPEAIRTGRQPQFLFSGLLTCAVCGANYTMRDAKFYSCASWLNGKACSNKIGVKREVLERLLLAEIKAGLASPAIVEHVRQELARRLRRKAPKIDKVRVRELEQEVGNLVDAIGKGLLSPAVAARLAAAESELERLKAPATDNALVVALLPRLDELFLQRVRELERTAERDPVRARQALLDSIDTPIALHPVDGVLEAEIGVRAPLAVAAGTDRKVW